MSVRYNHVHIYERSLSNKEIYRCVVKNCPHYQKREFLKDKEARCFSCHELFTLSWPQLRNKHPVCVNCSKSKKAEQVRDLKDQIADLFPKVTQVPRVIESNEAPEVQNPEMEWK